MRYRSIVFLVLLMMINWPVYGRETAIRSRDMLFNGADFSQGTGENIRTTSDGLTLTARQSDGNYRSPIIKATIPFNVLTAEWQADLPAGSQMTIWLRTSNRQGVWSEWYELHESHDMTQPGDATVISDFIAVPAVDKRHTHFQFNVALNRLLEEPPILRQLAFTLIDSSDGPTVDELIAQQERLNQNQRETASEAYPKPAVISREVWCTHPACNYDEGLRYESVTHLIVHHTATANDRPDWAAVVRAIWHNHTFSREWGDIGYNYLIDRNGLIYEGRLGGDDVVGTHAGAANAGAMGVGLLGHFSFELPPELMLESTIELLAWKAAQKEIDVYSASRLPYMRWGTPHLMGHRDVYGTTQCPGDQLHALLPWLKDQVAARIGFVSPYVYVDELSDAFSKSVANWYTPPGGCGFNRHAYYTWSTTNPAQSVNWGTWQLDLPEDGRYQIAAYVPYCITGRAETEGATYQIGHAGRVSTRTFSQEEHVGTWIVLGDFDVFADQASYVFLNDLTETDSGLGVWFDALRWQAATEPPSAATVNAQPANMGVVGDWPITFQWEYASDVITLDVQLQVAATPDFAELLLAVDLPVEINHYTHFFEGEYEVLYWRVAANTHFHGMIQSAPTQFIIDRVPPVSAVEEIYRLFNNHFVVKWDGYDEHSAVVAYNIDYRLEGDDEWTRWLTGTVNTQAVFTPPPIEEGERAVYWFRSQAIDAVGNVESDHPLPGDKHTDDAILLEQNIWLPVVRRP